MTIQYNDDQSQNDTTGNDTLTEENTLTNENQDKLASYLGSLKIQDHQEKPTNTPIAVNEEKCFDFAEPLQFPIAFQPQYYPNFSIPAPPIAAKNFGTSRSPLGIQNFQQFRYNEIVKENEHANNFGFKTTFTIIVENESFAINKTCIASQSDFVKFIIESNPDADTLELVNVSIATFKEIVRFLHTGILPRQDSNLIEIYDVGCRLQIATLKFITAELIKSSMNQNNAYDILMICNKYSNADEDLKMKAFMEFAKLFPMMKLNAEIASQPEKLKALMSLKPEIENAFL
jgi:hypothetical protein